MRWPASKVILSQGPYPIQAMIISGGNPASAWPDSPKFTRLFRKLKVLVVIDLFMTETARGYYPNPSPIIATERVRFRSLEFALYLPITSWGRKVARGGNTMVRIRARTARPMKGSTAR